MSDPEPQATALTSMRGRRVTTTRKVSLSLTGDAQAAVEELADEWNTTVSEVIRRAIVITAFFQRQQKEGATVLVTRDGGKTIENVHFVFS